MENNPSLTGVGGEREGCGELDKESGFGERVRRAGEREYELLYREYELVTNVLHGGERRQRD